MITTKWNLTGSISGDHELSGEVNKEVEYVIPSTLDLDYEKAKNKPSINGVTLVGNKTTSDLGIENYDDTEIREEIAGKQPIGNYLTEESDPTVASYIKTITQNDISNWNNKSDFSGSYNDASDKPSINGITLLGNKTADELGITGGEQVFYWDGNKTDLQFWNNIYQLQKTTPCVVYTRYVQNNYKILQSWYYNNDMPINKTSSKISESIYIRSGMQMVENSYTQITEYVCDLYFTIVDDQITAVNFEQYAPTAIKFLSVGFYPSAYVPTSPGAPATKKYVDDAITTAISQITDGDGVSY